MKTMAFCAAIAIMSVSGAALATDFTVVTGDYAACPGGYIMASPAAANDYKSQACSVLGTWYIVRLADGGSMDGSGYGCKVRGHDSRSLGHTLCMRW